MSPAGRKLRPGRSLKVQTDQYIIAGQWKPLAAKRAEVQNASARVSQQRVRARTIADKTYEVAFYWWQTDQQVSAISVINTRQQKDTRRNAAACQ